MKKITLAIMTALLWWGAAQAAVPGLVNFQGRLLDSNKLPRNGDFLMSFKICNSLAATCSAPCAACCRPTPRHCCVWTAIPWCRWRWTG